MDVKRYVRNHEVLMRFLALIYRVIGFNSIKGKSNMKISWGGYLHGVRISRIMEKTTV